jgi:hypothetical protein
MAVMLAIDENLVRTESIESGHEGDISPTRLPSEGFESFRAERDAARSSDLTTDT